MTLRPGVTAVIPTIAPRAGTFLHRALDSVLQQQHPVSGIAVSSDADHQGAAATRNRALAMVDTMWSAFLDDDDEWNTDHIRLLMMHALETGADMVYPWFTVSVPEPRSLPPQDFLSEFERQPFRGEWLDEQNMIPVTVLIKTDLIRAVGGFQPKGPPSNPCDDWGAWLKVRDAGAKIVHLPRRTWIWHWHPGNTNGRGDRW